MIYIWEPIFLTTSWTQARPFPWSFIELYFIFSLIQIPIRVLDSRYGWSKWNWNTELPSKYKSIRSDQNNKTCYRKAFFGLFMTIKLEVIGNTSGAVADHNIFITKLGYRMEEVILNFYKMINWTHHTFFIENQQ